MLPVPGLCMAFRQPLYVMSWVFNSAVMSGVGLDQSNDVMTPKALCVVFRKDCTKPGGCLASTERAFRSSAVASKPTQRFGCGGIRVIGGPPHTSSHAG